MTGLLGARVFFMITRNHRSPLLRRKHDLVILIRAFLKCRLQQLRRFHLAIEFLRAAHRFQPEISAFLPAGTGTITAQSRSHAIAQCEQRGEETRLGVYGHHQIEHRRKFLHIHRSLATAGVPLIERRRIRGEREPTPAIAQECDDAITQVMALLRARLGN